jgi:dienelactone hydrolase
MRLNGGSGLTWRRGWLTSALALTVLGSPCLAAEWPPQVKDIAVTSTADNTQQPALFYTPDTADPKPLLVALHTWSSHYRQPDSIPYADWCIEKDWVFIHPNFRGPNKTPEATGSDLVVQDIVDAVAYAKENANVDPRRVYLVGASGGGYTSLLMAGRVPDLWAGVSSWVPLTDLKQWYLDCKKSGKKYAGDIVASLGGIPTENPDIEREAAKRSPMTHLPSAKSVPIDLNAGIHDGHTGSIPIDHSLRAFNLLAKDEDRLSEEDIAYMVEKAEIPGRLAECREDDPAYCKKTVLFRKKSNNIRLTLFEGGHEMVFEAALSWLSKQRKAERTP